MGTSTCHRSPTKQLPWQFANLGYQSNSINSEQIVNDVFRAVSATHDVDYISKFSSPTIISFLKIVDTIKDPKIAEISADTIVSRNKDASLYIDIAKRAMIKTINNNENSENYFNNLFAETADYLVSRDINGYLGSDKIKKVRDIINIKKEIRDVIIKKTKKVKRKFETEKQLRNYVSNVMKELMER